MENNRVKSINYTQRERLVTATAEKGPIGGSFSLLGPEPDTSATANQRLYAAGTMAGFFFRAAAGGALFDRMNSAIRGAISARKREPLNTP